MIPENDSIVQHAEEKSSAVKTLLEKSDDLPIGDVTGFEAIERTIDMFTKTAPTEIVDSFRSMYPDMRAMLEMIDGIRDKRMDEDVRLLDTLDRMGAMVVTNRWMPADVIVVTLPERFDAARDEQARRKKARQDMMDTVVSMTPPRPFVNLCNEIPMP